MSGAVRLKSGRYDARTIALHWGVALGVLFQWLGAHAIDRFGPGAARVDARSVHVLVGVLLLAGLGYRLWWRLRRGRRLAPVQGPALTLAAGAIHVALYTLVAVALVLGLFNTWIRGDSILGAFHIPKFGDYAPQARHALANEIVAWHRLAANAILVVAGVHASAAILHHVWLRDGVLQRMIPQSTRSPGRVRQAARRVSRRGARGPRLPPRGSRG
jgi:cytochrome b561